MSEENLSDKIMDNRHYTKYPDAFVEEQLLDVKYVREAVKKLKLRLGNKVRDAWYLDDLFKEIFGEKLI